MKQIHYELNINEVRPGMILEKDVFFNGNLLLGKGTVIKPSYINQLKVRQIQTVSVFAGEVDLSDILPNPIQQFYAKTYQEVAALLDAIKEEKPISTADAFAIVERIIETIFNYQNAILQLTGFPGVCDYYYAHSLDVCIYSLITGKALNLEHNRLMTLGMGALLHDVGKAKIPEAILFKPDSLTPQEYEISKKHAQHSYDILSRIPMFKRDIAQIALQHHERCDGSGYPQHLKANEIHPLAKIVAIADIYDALTSDRVYKTKILPHEAAEHLLGSAATQIDREITPVFIKNIAIYPPGAQVLLNTNEIAVVTDHNAQMPLRPVLKIITDRKRNPLKNPYRCDLQSNPHLTIVQLFN